MRTEIKTTCPRDCYDACGIRVVKDGDKVRKVLGDPEHHVARGTLCGKCAIAYNGAWRDEKMRLKTPLKRIGPKGKGKFVPISWDDAFDEIAKRLSPTLNAGDNAKVLHTHYTGTVALISGWFPIRFFNHIGATEVDPDSVCNRAGHTALEYMFGNSLDGFDPNSLADAACILVWGANPSHSAPHMHKGWLRGSKAKRIVVDPIGHETATEADMHLKLRPGTDAALAFSFMHIAQRDGLLDQDFIADQTVGFDEIQDEIAKATPEWAEHVTGVPAAQIEEAARFYATGPSLLWLGQGMQRTAFGGNAFRSLATLSAVTGNLTGKGCGTTYMNGPNTRGVDIDYLTADHLRTKEVPFLSHLDLPDTLLNSEQSKILFCWNNNILASSPRQSDLRTGLAREDLFHVCVELFHTDTTQYADIILPAASFLEFNDLVLPYFHNTVSAQVQAVSPLGEALPNQEIFRRLSRAMGFNVPELLESDEAILEKLLAQSPYEGTFRDLAAIGTAEVYDNPRLPFDNGPIPTDSGRVEIASARAEADGLPRTPFAHADAPSDAGVFRILSPASAWLMNSSYGNDQGILERLGQQKVLLHPKDCNANGLSDGDPVTLRNDTGSVALHVMASEAAQPGMAILYKGSWPALSGGGNVNALNPGTKSDIGESSTVHSIEARLIHGHEEVPKTPYEETDVVVVGAGPVGLFTVFAAGQVGLNCVVIDSLPEIGGQCAALYPEKPIYDIPSRPSVTGGELIADLREQASVYAPTYHLGEQVTYIHSRGDDYHVWTSEKRCIRARSIILAAGSGAFGPNRPPLEDLAAYEEKSVFYHVRETEALRGKKVVIAGGGDSAVDWALALIGVAQSITLVHRRNRFSAAPASVAKLAQAAERSEIELLTSAQLAGLSGQDGQLSAVSIREKQGDRILPADVLLPFFGLSAELGPLGKIGYQLERKTIVVDPSTSETSVPGVFAVGDVAHYQGKLKLILNGFAEASIAAHAAYGRSNPDQTLHFEYSTTKGVPVASQEMQIGKAP